MMHVAMVTLVFSSIFRFVRVVVGRENSGTGSNNNPCVFTHFFLVIVLLGWAVGATQDPGMGVISGGYAFMNEMIYDYDGG